MNTKCYQNAIWEPHTSSTAISVSILKRNFYKHLSNRTLNRYFTAQTNYFIQDTHTYLKPTDYQDENIASNKFTHYSI